ncbi:hypothetical protein [Psychrobacter urativorans]|uniref:Uncharacterized protein n=1 Tax=Psychrobacter urativorans TaxID=45610 RepID=A0A0M4TDI2_9GAMM|nr:hypothetical protein [Psychrobacter urativorans]ALF60195.1 hypothetical protein AOC03_09225 [Psychrobacter urativorans]
MKKSLLFLSVIFLGQTTFANAATDWTPYLKPMLSGCGYVNPTDKLPARYKASIASTKVKGNPKIEGEEVYTTYTLKNANAFGQPLIKVEYLQGYEWYYLKLYFKDSKFTALRPQFKLPKIDKEENEYITIVKNDASGYEIEQGGYLSLSFDKTQKTITCEAGV